MASMQIYIYNLLSLFCIFTFQVIPTHSQTISRIPLGSTLLASPNRGSSWKPPSGDFAIGFHRLDNQKLYLLAIWFDKIPDKTIVWYANGDNLAQERSKLELTFGGQLKLTGPNGATIWEAQSTNASYASLLDSGNFILADGTSSNRYPWQSFDHPADTILPTQELQINGVLSSRETRTNFYIGRYQLRLVPEGDLVLAVVSSPSGVSYEPYYRSKTADDNNVMNSGNRVVFNETSGLYVVRRNGGLINLTSHNMKSPRDYYFRATLDFDGLFMLYSHPKSPRDGVNWDEAWHSVWYEPQNICVGSTGDYGRGPCGFNSICSLDSYGRPSCVCLPGFKLLDSSNPYGGCKQEIAQICDANDLEKVRETYEMRPINNAFWPSSQNYERFPLSSEDECNRSCFGDCNCIVAVIKDGICWKKKLPLSNGRNERDTYGKALIKISKGNNNISWDNGLEKVNGDEKDQSRLVLVLSILLGSSLLLNFVLVGASSIAIFPSYQKTKKLNTSSSLLETNLRVFTFEELKDATDGFREELGRGAFGTVYKGVITNSSLGSKSIVAIKKLEKLVEGDKEFKTEASVIAKTHHKNLVRLVGFCEEGPNGLLVYEFMSNGTLASFVFGISKPDWNKRVQMAIGIARGIAYLHEECTTQIIHCDIKPHNVLLDESFTARISDFGLAKLLMSDQTQTMIRGTKGYVAPEWFRSKPVTVKVDVYSYRVLLLEIVCCRKNVKAESENAEEIILTDWAYDCYKQRKLEKLIENEDEAKNDMQRVERLVMVAIWCIQEDPSLRPSMKKVVQMLEGVIEISSPPCPSPFISMC
ncbi:G-type lectin S-receptor-like serine/threonine-protein kinase LECRK3 [Bidens hawaiensis]|uniref:G-type lectin S-receptor-like serine/threonine-protein kinase LECRK3 n=1 Tax=Bidens hawaiensis TaxID=980011 RepID=UPI00404ABF8B